MIQKPQYSECASLAFVLNCVVFDFHVDYFQSLCDTKLEKRGSDDNRDAVIHAHIPHGAEDEEDERVEPKRMNTGVARRMMPIPEQSE